MKKTVICLLLVFSFLVGISACASAPETETETGQSSAAEEQIKFPVIADKERSLLFRYYYISIWLSVCANVKNTTSNTATATTLTPPLCPTSSILRKPRTVTHTMV